MKIAIIGKGTSAIISALTCILRGHEVEIYYDPDKPCLNVGESTTPIISNLLYNVLDICVGDLVDNGIASVKNGIKFINWGYGKSDYFRHHFSSNLDAFQFESSIFNPFIHKKIEELGIVYHAKKVTQYGLDTENDKIIIDQDKYDFLISCAGWSDTDEYNDPIFETVNSGILYIKDGIDDPTYTIHCATEHGWQFGLPFPHRNLTKCGYFFNKKFENKEELQKKLGKENCRTIDWKQKYAKRMVTNKYEAYNGNRLMFLDPLHALGLHYYARFAEYICDYLDDRTLATFELCNHRYYQDMFDLQISVAFHYSYGSKFDSVFWKDAHKRSEDFLNLHPKYQKQSLQYSYNYSHKYRNDDLMNIGVFGYQDYRALHSGMTGTPMNEICKDIFIPGF
jgi:hypothetical protein